MAIFEVELDRERGEPQNDIITAHQTTVEGSTVEMVCSLCAKDVTWWKAEDVSNGRQAVSNGTFLIGGHVLRLGPLHMRDSGQYCCHGNNTEGTVLQACTRLEVLRTSKLTVYIYTNCLILLDDFFHKAVGRVSWAFQRFLYAYQSTLLACS